MSCGIYQIKNKINNKKYIGSSFNIEKRIQIHKRVLYNNKHHSVYLQNAYNKYGSKNFVFSILELCDKKTLRKKEQFYLDNWKPEYNVSIDALAPMTGRKHSLRTKKILSKIHKGNTYNLGRKFTQKQKDDIRNRQLGTKRSEKTKRKMSKTAKRLNSISRIDHEKRRKKIEDNLGNIYNSLTEAAIKNNASISAVCDNLKNRSFGLRNGVQFRYLGERKRFNRKIIKTRGKGENAGLSKLKETDVLFIRKNYKRLGSTKLSKKFKVHKSTIIKIYKRETWTYV